MNKIEIEKCERFKEVRNLLGMRQGDFAKEIKTTQGHVSDIENKRKAVSDRVVEIICLKYGISEKWFLTGEGTPKASRTRSQEIGIFANEVMNLPDESIKKRLIEALTKLDSKDWEAIERIADKLLNDKKEGD